MKKAQLFEKKLLRKNFNPTPRIWDSSEEFPPPAPIAPPRNYCLCDVVLTRIMMFSCVLMLTRVTVLTRVMVLIFAIVILLWC